jgi:hypothetical protein
MNSLGSIMLHGHPSSEKLQAALSVHDEATVKKILIPNGWSGSIPFYSLGLAFHHDLKDWAKDLLLKSKVHPSGYGFALAVVLERGDLSWADQLGGMGNGQSFTKNRERLNQALVEAAMMGFSNAVEALIERGASPRYGNSTPLQRAAENGHWTIVQKLQPLSSAGSNDHYAIRCAASHGNVAMTCSLASSEPVLSRPRRFESLVICQ